MKNNKSKIPRLGGGTTGLWFEHPWHLPSGNQTKQWNIVHLQWSFPALNPHYFNYFPANHGRLPTIIAFHGCKTHNTGKAGDGLPTLPIHWTCLSLKEKSPAPSFPINQLFSKKTISIENFQVSCQKKVVFMAQTLYWLVVYLPLRQLGWCFPIHGKSSKSCSKPPTS